jgi:hypothetical protein
MAWKNLKQRSLADHLFQSMNSSRNWMMSMILWPSRPLKTFCVTFMLSAAVIQPGRRRSCSMRYCYRADIFE